MIFALVQGNQADAVCECCGHVFGQYPLEVPLREKQLTIADLKRRITSTKRFTFKVKFGTSSTSKAYNVRVPVFFSELVETDVLFSGSFDFKERTLVIRRARLNARCLLGIIYSREARAEMKRRPKTISFAPFLSWRQTPSDEFPGSPGLIFVVKKDGTIADPKKEPFVMTQEESFEIVRSLEVLLLQLGDFLLKTSLRNP